jgi:hypothetical protein
MIVGDQDPDHLAPFWSAGYALYSNRQNSVPIAIVISGWERHLAAIPIEAGRLSHMSTGTYF